MSNDKWMVTFTTINVVAVIAFALLNIWGMRISKKMREDIKQLNRPYETVATEIIADLAEDSGDPCVYGDNCPDNAGTRHGTCRPCKARLALKRWAEFQSEPVNGD